MKALLALCVLASVAFAKPPFNPPPAPHPEWLRPMMFGLGTKDIEKHGCASARADKAMSDFLLRIPRFYAEPGKPMVLHFLIPSVTDPDRRVDVTRTADTYQNGVWVWTMPKDPNGSQVTLRAVIYTVRSCLDTACEKYASSITLYIDQVYKGSKCSEMWSGEAVRQ